MKKRFNTAQEIKDILKSKIFTVQPKGTYLFEDDTYAMLQGNISLFLDRDHVTWKHIRPTHKYSIFQYETNFIFRTYKHELYADDNEFLLSIDLAAGVYTVIFTSVKNKVECLRLVSE